MQKKQPDIHLSKSFGDYVERILGTQVLDDERMACGLIAKGDIEQAKVYVSSLYHEGLCHLAHGSEVWYLFADFGPYCDFERIDSHLMMGIWLSILDGHSQRISEYFTTAAFLCQEREEQNSRIQYDAEKIRFSVRYGYALFMLGAYRQAYDLILSARLLYEERTRKQDFLYIPITGAISRLLLPICSGLLKDIKPDSIQIREVEKEYFRAVPDMDKKLESILYLYHIKHHLKTSHLLLEDTQTPRSAFQVPLMPESEQDRPQVFLFTTQKHQVCRLGDIGEISSFSSWCNQNGQYPALSGLSRDILDGRELPSGRLLEETDQIILNERISDQNLILAEKINSTALYTVTTGIPLLSGITREAGLPSPTVPGQICEERVREIASRLNPEYATATESSDIESLSKCRRPGNRYLFSLIRGNSDRLRNLAASRIKWVDPVFVPLLLDLLTDADDDLADIAVSGIQSLLSHLNLPQREIFCSQNPFRTGTKAVELLISSLRSGVIHPDRRIRLRSVRCLRDQGNDPGFHEILLDAYHYPDDQDTRRGNIQRIIAAFLPEERRSISPPKLEAASGLARYGDYCGLDLIVQSSSPQALPFLARKGDRRGIPYILSRLSEPRNLDKLISACGEDIIDPLIEFSYQGILPDKDKKPGEYRLVAAQKLLLFSSPRLVPYYAGLLNHPSTEFQAVGIQGLAKERPPGYLDEIRKKLDSADDDLILIASLLLYACKDPEGEVILKKSLEPGTLKLIWRFERINQLLDYDAPEYPIIRWIFSQRSGKWWRLQEMLWSNIRNRDCFRGQKNVPLHRDLSQKMLNSSRKDARSMGLSHLLLMPVEEVSDSITAFLDRAKRTEIPNILIKLAESDNFESTVPIATRYTGAEEPKIRKASAYLLRKAGVTSASPILAGMLSDPDISVRYSALRALETCSDGTIPAVLVHHLIDPDPRIRLSAVLALAKEKTESSVREVSPLIRDPNPAVRAAVVSFLVDTVPGAKTADLIVPLLDDPSWTVRISVVKGLSRGGRDEDIPRLQRIAEQDTAYDPDGVSIRRLARDACEKISGVRK